MPRAQKMTAKVQILENSTVLWPSRGYYSTNMFIFMFSSFKYHGVRAHSQATRTFVIKTSGLKQLVLLYTVLSVKYTILEWSVIPRLESDKVRCMEEG